MRERSTALAHQFEDMEQQREATSLGMWVFLVTEIMFFGGLFLGYVVYRTVWSNEFAEASRHLDVVLGGVNTAVLLCSSLTMAIAVHSAQSGGRRMVALFLVATMLLGGVFLGIKFLEYYHKYTEKLIPGPDFQFPQTASAARSHQIFFSLYFIMTGMHALHMVIGLVLMALFTVPAFRGKFTREYYAPVEVMGLYWHFVDIVWVFLFPLLYLIDRS